MKTRHNKKRNIAFVYEALIMEMTKASIEDNKDKRDKSLRLLKKYFSAGKPLSKELELYRTLSETKCKNRNYASRLLSEAKNEYAIVVTADELYNEQGKLISEINKEISPTVFSNFVPNYKSLATIYQIFNHKGTVKSRSILEESLVNSMCTKPEQKEVQEPLDNLTYRFFMERYNKEYGEVLSENQKKVLSYYVMSFSDNGVTLKSFLNEEVGRLRSVILESNEIEKDPVMQEMAGKVLQFVDSLKEYQVDETAMRKILEIQELVYEIEKKEENTNENQ